VFEVRRENDGELCGFVAEVSAQWQSLTVFGAVLDIHDDRDAATLAVLDIGLASLAERWQLQRPGSEEAEIVCIQEADPTGVTLALDYSSLPGVPTLRLTRAELDGGAWRLFR
jgi:hypothetical protein